MAGFLRFSTVPDGRWDRLTSGQTGVKIEILKKSSVELCVRPIPWFLGPSELDRVSF